MRLQRYINEARVKTTNSDAFIRDHYSVFMWNPKEGLIWSAFDKNKNAWLIYKGSKFVKSYNSDVSFLPHAVMLVAYNKKWNLDDYVTGRISPNGKSIYIHDLKSKPFTSDHISIHWDRYVDKAVNDIYKYMKDYIK